MLYETILVENHDGIRTITLNRPTKLNSINYDVISELEHAVNSSQYNDEVRVVVLKGSGRAFCAGDDLKGMGTEKNPSPDDHIVNRVDIGYPRLIKSLRELRKPVIGFIHGYALGAGCDLALSCDMIFATEETKFGLVFAQRGLVGGTILLPTLIGYQKACELLFSGNMFTAQEAKNMGIVNYVAPTYEEIESMVNEWATRFSKSPTTALGLMKQSINQGIGASLERSIDIQKHMTVGVYHTKDSSEGKQAFVEKREANFIGK
ncbi:enoyl-CoA hydratase/isomerase family protein [Bacillus sp. JJ1562]|uniref:enoyl-CoA hydratase/isomerase family protein n=1 Tax=Bacillus sp. JJ1562 TaxID=3122960 RepID=UPI003001C949